MSNQRNLGQTWDFQSSRCESTMDESWSMLDLFQSNHAIALNLSLSLSLSLYIYIYIYEVLHTLYATGSYYTILQLGSLTLK